MNDYDWLSMLLYRECSYRSLPLDEQRVIVRTYRDRKFAIKITRGLFKLGKTIRNLGNNILKYRIKSKLEHEHLYRYTRGWWS